MLRHGGPSEDALSGARGLQEIQRRGRRACVGSVRRYERHGSLPRRRGQIAPEFWRWARGLLAAQGHEVVSQLSAALKRAS
eukprot:7897926-Lingulodinium_polyedra.AAC.1